MSQLMTNDKVHGVSQLMTNDKVHGVSASDTWQSPQCLKNRKIKCTPHACQLRTPSLCTLHASSGVKIVRTETGSRWHTFPVEIKIKIQTEKKSHRLVWGTILFSISNPLAHNTCTSKLGYTRADLILGSINSSLPIWNTLICHRNGTNHFPFVQQQSLWTWHEETARKNNLWKGGFLNDGATTLTICIYCNTAVLISQHYCVNFSP